MATAVLPIVMLSAESSEASGLTLVVDSAADRPDSAPGDDVCDTGTGGGVPECTLRAAIEEAEASSGHDRIEFDIPGKGIDGRGLHRITPATALPAMVDPGGVTIDGYTQDGATPNTRTAGTDAVIKIELRGTGPTGIDGLEFRSPDNVVRGLALYDFRRHIRLFGDTVGSEPGADSNTIQGNFIGTDATAAFAADERVSSASGVHLERGARSNLVGGSEPADRNLISGNADRGIALFDDNTDFNRIVNNIIGLAPNGVDGLANLGHGVDINSDASDNLVGGWNAHDANVISANVLSGVEISHNSTAASTERNQVIGNLIGTTADGIDGTAATGNGEAGVNLEGNARCADVCPPDIAHNLIAGNVIVGSPADILIWKGAHHNRIVSNHIGVLADGSIPTGAATSPTTRWAVMIQAGAVANTVEANVIGGVPRGIHLKPDNNFPDDCKPTDTTCPGDAVFATYGNTITRNSIDRIDAGLGIDLYAARSSGYSSGPGAPSPLVNAGIGAPSITSANTDRLVVDGCAGCVLEVFETPTPDCSNCWAGHGRGQRFVVDATLASANATVTLREMVADPYVLTPGVQISATVTDPAGNTSEFSARVTVEPGWIPPPRPTTFPGDVRIDSGAIVTLSADRCRFNGRC